MALQKLKKRSDFLRVARGRRYVVPGLVLQARPQADCAEDAPFRVGFTVTKKVGNAVIRNRVRRRLKEAARLKFQEFGKPATDYVLIGRHTTIDRPFQSLLDDLTLALQMIAKPKRNTHRNKDKS